MNLVAKNIKIFFGSKKYMQSQKWTTEQIHEFQDVKLKTLIKHASMHVPYYKNLFNTIGLDVNGFKGCEDMHLIPFLEKDTLRKHFNEFISDNAKAYGINWDSTSGSTGKPLKLLMSDASIINKKAASIRAYMNTGYSFRDKTFSLQSYKHSKQTIFIHEKLSNTYKFDAKKLSLDFAKTISNMMSKEKPKFLVGYPFAVYQLGQFIKQLNKPITSVSGIITAGETLSDSRRAAIEEMFSTKVFDYYSHHESVALITECRHQKKHLNEDFAYNEFIKHEGSEDVATLVGTGFYNYAMPLIRYKIDDLIELYHDDFPCECGISFKKIKHIIGRQNDFIETPDGRVLGNVMEHSIDRSKSVVSSQCVQDTVDHIYVNVIVEDDFQESSFDLIREDLQKRIGTNISIDFNIVKELEKNLSGKTPFIFSKIGNTYI